MIGLGVDTFSAEKAIRLLMKELGLAFGDFRDFFIEYDAWLTGHIKSNYDREGPNWKGLAPRTRYARRLALERGDTPVKHRGSGRAGSVIYTAPTGYYRQNKPLRRVGEAHPIGQWTGKARRRALKKGKAQRKRYLRDFGPKDIHQYKLMWLHEGAPTRPPRRLYRARYLQKQLEKMAGEYGRSLVDALDKAISDLGFSERFMRRFSG